MCIILFILILLVQKFREEAQKAKMESERLQNLLLEKEVDAEMRKRELEMQKAEIANLNQRISEVSFSPLSNSVMTKYHDWPY
jgi:tmRNA-binding protein